MNCPKCGFDCPSEFDFCPRCATPLQVTCPQCGFRAPADFKFCPQCAAALAASAPVPPATGAMVERLSRLIPKEYAERLLATRGQPLDERRTVTILFSDIKGSTAMIGELDPEDAKEVVQGAFEFLIAPIFRYEGTLVQLMGDAILAFFGAPIAHEDDPERASRAALEIVAEAQEYAEKLRAERGIEGFGVRVGINTGLVVVGEVGTDLRVAYTAVGDAINLAARMEQNAPPGGVLITHDTYRHIRGVFDILRQEPLRVKGKAEPVQTYLVERAKPRAFRKPMRGVEGVETRMIGRQAELSRLQECFYTAMEDRELQMVTIVGDAGVGKSRLLHEFDVWSELLPQRFFYFKGRALQETQNLPYSLIRDLVAFRFQIEDSDPPSAVRQKLETGLEAALGAGEGSRMRAHLIGHLLGFELGHSSHLATALDDPKQIHDRALAYLTDYFAALAGQQPVLILLEDLHWADDSSLDVLNHLALALIDQRMMVVCAARPALYERRPHWGEGQPFHRSIALEPLTKRNIRLLLDEILQKVDQVPEGLTELVVAGAEGNPFFVEELVKMLVDDGVIIKGADRWRVEPSRLLGVRVPPSLRGVLQARLDHLPLQDRTILQQASVVGRLFWDRAVMCIGQASAEGLDEAQVARTLSALRDREMVYQRETSAFAGAHEYIFKHPVLREVTYETVLKRVRRAYHSLVADWLIEQGGDRAAEYAVLIADHLEQAGRVQECIDWLLQAGDRARRSYAHEEAVRAFQRALGLLEQQDDSERAARTWMKLGLTYHNAFQFAKARQAYDQGCALWHEARRAEPSAPAPPAPHALRVAAQEPLTVDPGLTEELASAAVVDILFSALLTLTPEMDVLPDVARSWDMLEGGRKYVFHLRDDVRWSDGTLLTAGDFEYSWKRTLDPATHSDNAELLYPVRGAREYHEGKMTSPDSLGVLAIDDETLAVELDEPTGYFLQLMAYQPLGPVPRHVVQKHGASWAEPGSLVTNGPYRLVAWERGAALRLERNPAYHGRFTGNVSSLLWICGSPRPGGFLAQYEQDDLDCLSFRVVPDAEHEAATQRHAGEQYSHTILATHYLAFDTSRPPFDDPRVRLAFCLAIDRDRLANVTLRGESYPAAGGFVPPGMPGHSPGIALPYDPEGARQLLGQAGYPNGRGFPLLQAFASATPSFVRPITAQCLAPAWREHLGVEITWTEMQAGAFYAALDGQPPNLWELGWLADYPDPDSFLRVSPWKSQTRWHNAAFEALVDGASRVVDQDERMRMYRQADQVVVQEAPILPLVYLREHLLVKPWVTRLAASPDGHRFWQDVIIEPH